MGDSVVEALFKAFEIRPEIFTKADEDTIQVVIVTQLNNLSPLYWHLCIDHISNIQRTDIYSAVMYCLVSLGHLSALII